MVASYRGDICALGDAPDIRNFPYVGGLARNLSTLSMSGRRFDERHHKHRHTHHVR
jgi:hypothetical protein